MKKIFSVLFLIFFFANYAYCETQKIENEDSIYYNEFTNLWYFSEFPNKYTYTRKQYDGAGSYSHYLNSYNQVAFTLTSDFDFIKGGVFYSIDNEDFKYYKIEYDGENFKQILLSYSEIQNLFPNAEIIELSKIDNDNKMWVHKPLMEKKDFIFVNHSEKHFHKLAPNCKKAQNNEIKGLITISRYGIYRFKHYGQRDGKLTIYVR